MNEITMPEIIAALQQTPEGRTQLELATQRAIIEQQGREIERLLGEGDPSTG
ncbi:MAG: hypothetical protein ABGX05_16645 [Pirellulaceae bacterium]|jgi:hypothetical protein